LVDNVKVMAKGQLSLPKDIPAILKVGTVNEVTLDEGECVAMVN
jgi:hypothetical protein